MKNIYLKLQITFYLVVSIATGHAQVADTTNLSEMTFEQLMNIRIHISSSKEKTIFNSPSTVSVIDADMIKSFYFLSVAEAINTFAGMNILKTTSRMDIPTSRGILEGHYSNNILFMINGVANWNATLGAASLERISINDVERIEVLKGPASVLYGTNAYSGAINVILKNKPVDKKSRSEINIGAGNKQTYVATGNTSFTVGKAKVSLFSNSYNQNGSYRTIIDAAGVPVSYRDFQDWQNATANIKYNAHSLLLNGFTTDQSKLGIDPLVSAGLGKPQTIGGYLANYTFDKKITNKFHLKLGVTYDYDHRLFPRETATDLSSAVKSSRTNGFLMAGWDMNKYVNLEVGGNYDNRTSIEYKNYYISKDSTLTESNLKNKSIYEYSAFSQLEVTYQKICLLAGIRLTKNQFYSLNTSPRITFVYSINAKNSLKLIYGESFRAPSLFEVYFLNPTKSLSGNKNLKPETSKSVEASYLTSFGKVLIQATLYHAFYLDKIIRYKSADTIVLSDGTKKANTTTYINGATFQATGFEIEAKYISKYLNTFLNYTYIIGDKGDQTSKDPNSDDYYNYNFRAIPIHTVKAGISVPIGNAYISLLGYGYSSMETQQNATSPLYVKIPAQYKLDFSAGYNMKAGNTLMRHQFSVKNLTNNDTFLPEVVDRTWKEIPWDFSRLAMYSLTLNF
jgi:outer membrane receptor protein involved in Fe transport